VAELTRWKGVGRWTAEVVLIRGLGRLDVFPAGDLAVLKRLAPSWLGRDAGEGEMRAFAARFRPFRSLALVYAFETLAAARPAPATRSNSPGRSSPTRRSSG
jgi:3-methyladenine DNA glycosylase/8-oxoguanine DNA glycosylase